MRALIVYGGWPGHQPKEFSEIVERKFLQAFDVEKHSDLHIFEQGGLLDFDIILPIWTQGHLTELQEKHLLYAIENGVGLVAWHGVADAFNNNQRFKQLLGGQFVAHPGEITKYRVNFLSPADHIAEGLEDFEIESEQYYMLVDPNNQVLATTTFYSQDMPWIDKSVMPVVWKRHWGKGKVFYCAIGHTPQDFEIPEVATSIQRGIVWASTRVTSNC